ncbi:MAG: hypothetical protein KDA21_09235, partial [Phycisphaerales bacterium]|nr:hypothetical protein [Phycisphaerales bacterium]
MRRTADILRRAGRRIMIRTFLAALGPALAATLVLGLAAAVVDRLVGPGLPWWVFVAVPVGFALMLALFRTMLKRPSPERVAGELDLHARLADRLASALDLQSRAPSDPFTVLVVEDAEAHAASVKVSPTLPLRWGRSWVVWPLVGAATVLAAMLWAPMRLLDNPGLEQAELERAAQRDAAADALDDVLDALDVPVGDTVEEDAATGATPEELDVLERIREQLARGEKDPDQARTETARVLSDAAERLESEAQREEDAARRLSEMMNGLDAPPLADGEQTPMADLDRLREALREQDLDQAMEALDRLDSRLDEMTPDERTALEEQIDALANDLDALREREAERERQAEAAADERLRDHGLDDAQIDELRRLAEQREVQEQLEREGFDREAARRLAEEIAAQNREREAQEQARRESQQLSEELRDAADDVKRDQSEPSSSEGQDQQQGTRET